ncbi:MAG: Nif3-like dinuclear metal center hexameric protein [Actinomycetes bacterium]
MRTVAEIVAEMAARTRPENAAGWDPVGLQLGDPKAGVERVAVCHEVTEAVVARVEEEGPDLLVSYHPLLFTPTRRIVAGRSAEARAYRLVRAGVALLVTHTDFDAAPGGAADSLASALGLDPADPFGADPDEPAIGRSGAFDGTLADLASHAVRLFGADGLRVHGEPDRRIERVAVVPGSGSSFIEQAADVADALVTGDVSHHGAVRALDLGLAIVDPGHTATERPGMRSLVQFVTAIEGIEVLDLTGLDPRTWGLTTLHP